MDARPLAGCGDEAEASADRLEAIAHVRQSTALIDQLRVKALAVIADLEHDPSIALPQRDHDHRVRAGVLRRVLESLEAAEVHRDLDLLGIAPHV